VPAKVADALRTHLAALHDFDKDDVELFLTADDPDVLLKQVARLQAQSGARKRNHVPREGTNPAPPDRPATCRSSRTNCSIAAATNL
jgi:hypothetical protein